VRLYSNPPAAVETLPKLLVRAISAPRRHTRPMSRQAQVRLNSVQAKELTAAYRAGMTIKELAQRYGVHRTTVSTMLRRSNVELRQRGLAASEVTEATRLFQRGWSLARLGARYAVDDMTVRRYLLLAGVVMRSPKGRSLDP
jgi:lambda repressor-like predicted transcriptional regulator